MCVYVISVDWHPVVFGSIRGAQLCVAHRRRGPLLGTPHHCRNRNRQVWVALSRPWLSLQELFSVQRHQDHTKIKEMACKLLWFRLKFISTFFLFCFVLLCFIFCFVFRKYFKTDIDGLSQPQTPGSHQDQNDGPQITLILSGNVLLLFSLSYFILFYFKLFYITDRITDSLQNYRFHYR